MVSQLSSYQHFSKIFLLLLVLIVSAVLADINDVTYHNVVPGILHSLCSRFHRQQIYTAVGNIVFAMNPFEQLPLYTASVVAEYSREFACCNMPPAGGGASSTGGRLAAGGAGDLPPHVFRVAQQARSCLKRTAQAQAILIGGESGAGRRGTMRG